MLRRMCAKSTWQKRPALHATTAGVKLRPNTGHASNPTSANRAGVQQFKHKRVRSAGVALRAHQKAPGGATMPTWARHQHRLDSMCMIQSKHQGAEAIDMPLQHQHQWDGLCVLPLRTRVHHRGAGHGTVAPLWGKAWGGCTTVGRGMGRVPHHGAGHSVGHESGRPMRTPTRPLACTPTPTQTGCRRTCP